MHASGRHPPKLRGTANEVDPKERHITPLDKTRRLADFIAAGRKATGAEGCSGASLVGSNRSPQELARVCEWTNG